MAEDQIARDEIVLMTRPAATDGPASHTLLTVLSSTVDLTVSTVMTVASVTGRSAARIVTAPVDALLDRVVPLVVSAVVERLDLTDLVLRNVDLGAVVTEALDDLDLTAIVLDRVDIDRVVAQADLDAIIDRIAVVDLANYVIDEIDLPQLIRDSTSGIAGDAMNAARRQAVGADRIVALVGDRLVFRRRQRRVDARAQER